MPPGAHLEVGTTIKDENGRPSVPRRDELRTIDTYWQLPQSLQRCGQTDRSPNTAQRSRASRTRIFLPRPALCRLVRQRIFRTLFLDQESMLIRLARKARHMAEGPLRHFRSDDRILSSGIRVGNSLVRRFEVVLRREVCGRRVYQGATGCRRRIKCLNASLQRIEAPCAANRYARNFLRHFAHWKLPLDKYVELKALR
jgi:hypothetical protein